MKKSVPSGASTLDVSRRAALKGAGALVGTTAAASLPGWTGICAVRQRRAHPARVPGPQDGYWAAYGRWYERTSQAAVQYINDNGGIAGRPVELVIEDDGTDPKRGAEVVEKFAAQHKVDFVFGTLFSHVVIGSAPAPASSRCLSSSGAAHLHVASGALNRYVQPGITDVRQQVSSMAPWVTSNLGKKITMIFPDYAFGHDHRDYCGGGAPGRRDPQAPADSPTETSFTKYFRSPDTDVIYHVMVGPGVLTFVREMGEFFGNNPRAVWLHRPPRGGGHREPGPGIPRGLVFLGGFPRYADGYPPGALSYREQVGVNEAGASVSDRRTSRPTPTCSAAGNALRHQRAVEQSGYQSASAEDKAALIETLESFSRSTRDRAPPGLQDVRRPDSSMLRPAVHLQGGERQAEGRPSNHDRGRLYEPEADYDAAPLGRLPTVLVRRARAGTAIAPSLADGRVTAPPFGPWRRARLSPTGRSLHVLRRLLLPGSSGRNGPRVRPGGDGARTVARLRGHARGERGACEFFMLGAVIAWWVSTAVGMPLLGFVLALIAAPLFVVGSRSRPTG